MNLNPHQTKSASAAPINVSLKHAATNEISNTF